MSDTTIYNTNTNRDVERGVCVIIRNESPNSSIEWRHGTTRDETGSINKFIELNYKMIVINDSVKEEILERLEEIAEQECLESHDSFLCIALSYGASKSIYDKTGSQIRFHEVFNRFSADMCPVLANKPKIFIFDFCLASNSNEQSSSDLLHNNNEKPESADTLLTDTFVLISMSKEFVADSDSGNSGGSLFIGKLIEVIRNNGSTTELTRLALKITSAVDVSKVAVNKVNIVTKSYGWCKGFYFSQNSYHLTVVYPTPLIQKTTFPGDCTVNDVFDLLRVECSDIEVYDVVIASSKKKLNSYAKNSSLSECDVQTIDKIIVQFLC